MNSGEEVIIHREDLYRQVWEKPATEVAAEYGISDVMISKICRKLNVPKPGLGYWARLRAGYRIPRTPLPKLRHGQPATYTVTVPDEKEPTYGVTTEAELLISELAPSLKNLAVSEQLRNPHPLVRMTLDSVAGSTSDKYGMLRSTQDGCLAIRVSPDNLKRALKIVDALLKYFESAGFYVFEKRGWRPVSCVRIFEEEVRFSIEEKANRFDHVPTKEEMKHTLLFQTRWDYAPTGRLALHIDEWTRGTLRTQWSDRPSRPLEDNLPDIVIGFVKIADLKRQETIRKEECRRREERERLRIEDIRRQIKDEEERLQDLEKQAALWIKSQQIRSYIQAVEKKAATMPDYERDKNKLHLWVCWAKKHADRLDPLNWSLPWEK